MSVARCCWSSTPTQIRSSRRATSARSPTAGSTESCSRAVPISRSSAPTASETSRSSSSTRSRRPGGSFRRSHQTSTPSRRPPPPTCSPRVIGASRSSPPRVIRRSPAAGTRDSGRRSSGRASMTGMRWSSAPLPMPQAAAAWADVCSTSRRASAPRRSSATTTRSRWVSTKQQRQWGSRCLVTARSSASTTSRSSRRGSTRASRPWRCRISRWVVEGWPCCSTASQVAGAGAGARADVPGPVLLAGELVERRSVAPPRRLMGWLNRG